MFPLSPASSRSTTHPEIRSESTLEKPARQTKHRPLPCSCGPAPCLPRSRAAPRGSPHLAGRTFPPPAPRACALRPQGPRWASGARPRSGPVPPGCRLHGVGFGSLNGRCGACPEDIFQLVRTLATTTLSPSASQALALRRPGPYPDCWVRPRRAGERPGCCGLGGC